VRLAFWLEINPADKLTISDIYSCCFIANDKDTVVKIKHCVVCNGNFLIKNSMQYFSLIYSDYRFASTVTP